MRAAIDAATRIPEPQALPALLAQARVAPQAAQAVDALARRLARGLREAPRAGGRAGLVQALLQEFSLSSQEGVALMCLAEALLRIPDADTRDALIRDKIGTGDWQAHLGRSRSPFVNAATWGLLLTGRLVATHSQGGLGALLHRVVGRGGEPLVRKGVDLAMRLMGEQFVTGETIAEALENARPRESQGFRYSYDMLGEAAMTAHDAWRYSLAYEAAIHAIGHAAAARGVRDGPGISIKLSALHPRYGRAQADRVHDELYPRLLHLALLARSHDIGLNIDAEESERLALSLDLLERLCTEPALHGWHGIGFVIQAYQKRCPAVIEHLIDLARRSGHRLMIRLVKGAYWDSEIKRAQLEGLDGYPVYTRKAHTDVAYLACARRLLDAPDAVYPQFATHNAHTVAAIHQMAGPHAPAERYEFQCLHGMGESLYEQVVGAADAGGLGRACRIYAPVGTHETLLAYLVRRLLENGANTSFVNRLADEAVPIDDLVRDPSAQVEAVARDTGMVGAPHPAIPLPRDLYGRRRANARGLDLASDSVLASLAEALAANAAAPWRAEPMLEVAAHPADGQPVLNPADRRDTVGLVRAASTSDLQTALACASGAAPAWAQVAPRERAALLERAADSLEADPHRLVALLIREAGKTRAGALAEVREAVDFMRYYASQVAEGFERQTHRPLGPVACISPWNFPLAIFAGQVAAALAAGNVVLAKPAEQTPLVAAACVAALWAAGVPRAVVQLLPGPGETVGAALVADPRVRGVLFTGSTDVARVLQRTLAARLTERGEAVPLIAETGGQNAMIVDSSALLEQVVADALASAFDSAGQRCSALRVLCVQADIAERLMAMLTGALDELSVGDPRRLATDVGPVIDAPAREAIETHVKAMRGLGHAVIRSGRRDGELSDHGCFVVPTIIEIDSLKALRGEVFGPVLHVLRYERDGLGKLLLQINEMGFGLTLGVHTRIDEVVEQVLAVAKVGNIYVNRNMVGAVVGVQPFGGEGLSGTGPKAGGPLYLLRLLSQHPPDAARQRIEQAGARCDPPAGIAPTAPDGMASAAAALCALQAWAERESAGVAPAARQSLGVVAQCCVRFRAQSPVGPWRELAGPTGESNRYGVLPRDCVLCLADDDLDRLVQLAAVLAVGARALWPQGALEAWQRLPAEVRTRVALVPDWTGDSIRFDAVLHHGSAQALREVSRRVAERAGPIVAVIGLPAGEVAVPLERLIVERAVSVNTAAAGGNASLMTIG